MKFTPTPLEGSFLIELEPHGDERGFFARLFCQKEFKAHHLSTELVQANNSLSQEKGTLRGMHYQTTPYQEDKLVRCIAGSIFDVIVDLRPNSPTYLQWFGTELSAKNRKMLYLPKGFAHGFLTLEENTELLYFVSEFYSPTHEKTLRWNDPQVGINWPFTPTVLSDKDKAAPDFITESSIV